VSAVESKIDDLYQVPLDEFTAARNALAKTLTGPDAQRVKTLAKPTVVPWAANQVYWKSRGTYDRLLKSGDRLRHAQLGALEGRRADVRAATETHRTALGDAVKEAERLAAAAGLRPAADTLMRTFEALSLLREPPTPPGRLTEALQPAGFEALAGVPVRSLQPSGKAAPVARGHDAPRGPAGPSAPRAVQKTDARAEAGGHADARKRQAHEREREERERQEERQRELAEAKMQHDAAVKKAEAVLARARATETMAREALARAEGAVASAAADLEGLRSKTP
jgi:hypothetical protein